MKVNELIEYLQELDGDEEIRLASQPNWPFEYKTVEAIYIPGEDINEDNDVVYIVEGEQIGYLPENIKESIGWKRS